MTDRPAALMQALPGGAATSGDGKLQVSISIERQWIGHQSFLSLSRLDQAEDALKQVDSAAHTVPRRNACCCMGVRVMIIDHCR